MYLILILANVLRRPTSCHCFAKSILAISEPSPVILFYILMLTFNFRVYIWLWSRPVQVPLYEANMGMSNREIAEQTGRNEEAIRALQFRAIRSLRAIMDEDTD